MDRKPVLFCLRYTGADELVSYYDGGGGGYSERRVRRVRPARATATTAFQWGTRERSNEPSPKYIRPIHRD